MNNINNNVNFTAKMDVSKVTMNKARWQKIATLFEQKSEKYPNDTFYMEDIANGINAYNCNSKNGSEICANIFGVEFDKLMNMSDSKIVSQFKKILDIAAHKQRIFDVTDDMKFWDEAVAIAAKETEFLQKRDPFLKDLDILF